MCACKYTYLFIYLHFLYALFKEGFFNMVFSCVLCNLSSAFGEFVAVFTLGNMNCGVYYPSKFVFVVIVCGTFLYCT